MGKKLVGVTLTYFLFHLVGELRVTAALEAHMKRHAAGVKDREARRRAEDEEAESECAELEQLKGTEGRAYKAEAKADTLAEFRADLRRKVAALNRSISRGEERLREIQETKASSSGASSSATT